MADEKKDWQIGSDSVEGVRNASSLTGSTELARRAYELWQKRGSPAGNPEVDWHQAEREFSAKSRGQQQETSDDLTIGSGDSKIQSDGQ